MKRLISLIIILATALANLWTLPVQYGRKVRRAWEKTHGWFSTKMVCQTGTLDAVAYVAKVVDVENQAQKERPDLLMAVHDRSAEITDGVASAKLPRVVAGSVQAMPIAAVNMVSQETESQITLTFDDDKGYPVVVDTSTQAETNVALRDTYAANGEDAHYRNRQMLISTKMAACAAGQRFKFENSTDDVLSWADVVKARRYLTNAKAPRNNRYMAIPASEEEALLKIDQFISAEKMGAPVMPDGVIGKLGGFWVMVFPDDELAKTHIADGTAGVSGDEVLTCYFFHKYGIAFGKQVWKMAGPQVDAGADAELWNLHVKQGAAVQMDTHICTFRKNAA